MDVKLMPFGIEGMGKKKQVWRPAQAENLYRLTILRRKTGHSNLYSMNQKNHPMNELNYLLNNLKTAITAYTIQINTATISLIKSYN